MRLRPHKTALAATALVWLVGVVVTLWLARYYIATLNFRDPDDALRLVEVRDWMAGQSWFDVTQYRINPPHSVPMHWSRLVDLPIAFFIWLYGLFGTQDVAERLAMTTVPLLMLGGLVTILHALTVRVTGRAAAGVVAAVILMTSVGVLMQFQPMRIDHHGWQITLTMLAIWLVVARGGDATRNAALAGLVMAVNLVIALESLPLAVGIGLVLALRYLRRAEDFGGLFAYVAMLGGGALVLLPVMLGWHGAVVPWCDSMSPVYILPVLLVAVTFGLACRFVPQGAVWQRLACLAVAGSMGVLLLGLATPQCLHGPFSTLDPLVYREWYVSVREGMPVWTQAADLRTLVPLPGLIGLLGTLLAIRFDAPERRARWIELLIVQAIAFAVSMMVVRAMGLAHVLAMPGNAWLFLAGLDRATRLSTAPGRVLAGFACFALTPLAAQLVAIKLVEDTPSAAKAKGGGAEGSGDVCVTRRGFGQLDAIPATVIFAPLDISAHLLAFSHHSVVGTGHHRNMAGMRAVISGFMADPDAAKGIVSATGARYVGLCLHEEEIIRYARIKPYSLTAALIADRPPSWLQRVPMERKDDIRLYRVVD